MNKERIRFIFLLTVFFCSAITGFSQSSSVFDANYFDTEDGKQPPLRVGKGFDITDTYRQTRFCFTPETANPNLLTRQENSQKTSITLHYTKDENEYMSLKSRGRTGKVSFLNLFSLGGSTLERFASSSNNEVERLVFIAKVDFGKFEFASDPQLTAEAQGIIDQKDYPKFISLFGTHYINGVRKEASVYVILKRASSGSSSGVETERSFGGKLPITLKTSVGFEVGDENSVNQSFNDEEFSVEIEIDGPSLSESELQSSVSGILNSNAANKVAAIKDLISNSLSGLSDPGQGRITQYYFAPFSLYSVEGIVWDASKESKLVNLNQAVLRAYRARNKVRTYAAADYLQKNEPTFKKLAAMSGGADWVRRYKESYNSMKPRLMKYETELGTALVDLEKAYKECSQIGCDVSPSCCNISPVEQRVMSSAGNAEKDLGQLESLEAEALELVENVVAEEEKPDCEKRQYGTVYVRNHSSNPYRLYVNGQLNQTIPGGTTIELSITLGTVQIKAEQVSGYLFYATINHREAKIVQPCQEVVLNVGFED